MPDPVTEVVLAEADLDALVSPTSSDVWREMHGHSTEAVAAIAAKLAKEGGGGGSLPDWWTVDSTPGSEEVEFAGEVSVSPQTNTVAHLFQVIAPAGYEANAPGIGPMFELYDTDNDVVQWSMDINGNFIYTQPTAHEFHESGILFHNETGPINAHFKIDSLGGLLVLSDIAGALATRINGEYAAFKVPVVVGSLVEPNHVNLPFASVALTYDDDNTTPALILTARTADGTEANATIPLTPA